MRVARYGDYNGRLSEAQKIAHEAARELAEQYVDVNEAFYDVAKNRWYARILLIGIDADDAVLAQMYDRDMMESFFVCMKLNGMI